MLGLDNGDESLSDGRGVLSKVVLHKLDQK